ncbi:MAG: 30S ribosomal protein S9 [Patescibacteria group bacterium]
MKKDIKKTVAKPLKISREPHSKELHSYTEGIGRRKTSVARVRIASGHGKFIVNGKELKAYFGLDRLINMASEPFTKLKLDQKSDVSVIVSGGGTSSQAGAVRLGLSRALTVKNEDLKKRLRKLGFLTRDSRKVERKKYGLKKARRAPQWQKR